MAMELKSVSFTVTGLFEVTMIDGGVPN